MVKGVSESKLPPESWRHLFDKAGIEFGYRPLATRAGLTPTRVHRLIRGGGTTNEAIQQVAEALGVNESRVRELRGEAAVQIKPFTLPDDAGRLTDNERDVIRAMVRALLDARDSYAVSADEAPPPGTPTQTGQAEEVPSSDDPEADPLAGLGREFGPDKIEDSDDGDEQVG